MGKIKEITQEDKVLNHMMKYGGITSMQAFELYHITRLSRCIFDLRHAGWDIVTDMVTSEQTGTRFGVYRVRGERG